MMGINTLKQKAKGQAHEHHAVFMHDGSPSTWLMLATSW